MSLDDRITAVVYLLLRDHITFGALEKVLSNTRCLKEFALEGDTIAAYAREVAKDIASQE